VAEDACPAPSEAPWIRACRDPGEYADLIRQAETIGTLGGPEAIARFVGPSAETEDNEVAWMIFLDIYGNFNGIQLIARGARDRVGFDLVDAFRGAVLTGSRYLVLTHNHPSGDPSPSEEDAMLTVDVGEAASVVGCVLLDHVVLGMGRAYSFRLDRFVDF
jgi:DNA repair protein RadC